ncbi:hypothetical protein EON63_06965 [archaeon]|nr:MAG: hypothetical protein EON63_06965 [archaeon]
MACVRGMGYEYIYARYVYGMCVVYEVCFTQDINSCLVYSQHLTSIPTPTLTPSENAKFVDMVEAAGIAFIGPSSKPMNLMGDKINSKRVAKDAKVIRCMA